MDLGEKHPSKAVPRGSQQEESFLLGLKLQVPALLFPLPRELPCLGAD